MEFGYFTLSDNHYESNPRTPNQFVADITAEALLCRHPRHAFGLDRRASFQLARRPLLPGPGARLHRRPHQAHPAGAGGDGAAAAPSDPRRRAVGDARSAQQRPRRFRHRPRLRLARIRAVPRVVRGQPGHLRGRPRGRAQAVGGGGPPVAPRQALLLRRRAHHAEAGAAADSDLCRLVLQAVDRTGRAARVRTDRGAVRSRHELRRAEAGGRPLSRDLRQARHQAGAADVQLLHAFRRQCRRRRRRSARARSATTRNA